MSISTNRGIERLDWVKETDKADLALPLGIGFRRRVKFSKTGETQYVITCTVVGLMPIKEKRHTPKGMFNGQPQPLRDVDR